MMRYCVTKYFFISLELNKLHPLPARAGKHSGRRIKGRACLSEASLHGPPPDASIAGCLFARVNRPRAVGPPSLLTFLRPAIRAEQESECAAGRMSRPPHPNPQAPPARCASNVSAIPKPSRLAWPSRSPNPTAIKTSSSQGQRALSSSHRHQEKGQRRISPQRQPHMQRV